MRISESTEREILPIRCEADKSFAGERAPDRELMLSARIREIRDEMRRPAKNVFADLIKPR